MSEMIERVARALEKLQMDAGDYAGIAYVDLARAAIEAMREPTKAMTLGIAAADWQVSKDLNWSDGWKIMIDEALK